MGDHEGYGKIPAEDVALPKATVNKFANDLAASLDLRLTMEARELLAECCTEFVQLLSSGANEVCEKESKKTITPEHVLKALMELGLGQFHDEVAEEYERHKEGEKGSRGKNNAKSRFGGSGITEEEMLRQYVELVPIHAFLNFLHRCFQVAIPSLRPLTPRLTKSARQRT
uniref:Transcription factor CBF/NF-Y/archaeal histone domain-containing protein n=1 Tax=Rhodosorus marinus TaxID=101924 RepID=A0A7S3EC30_9RHOD|mmetsp:Transcript_24271/g.95534  ORF Transcript_24271/g.95534 Transcript_24271/m.95534 type:complete len:171 (+) Transcript_24271:196-708(+)